MDDQKPPETPKKKGGLPNHGALVGMVHRLAQRLEAVEQNGHAPASQTFVPSTTVFEDWFCDALAALIGHEGNGILGRDSLPNAIDGLMAVWKARLIVEGADDDALLAWDERRAMAYNRSLTLLKGHKKDAFKEIEARNAAAGNTAITTPVDPEIDPKMQDAIDARLRAILGGGMPAAQPQPKSQEEVAEATLLDQLLADRRNTGV